MPTKIFALSVLTLVTAALFQNCAPGEFSGTGEAASKATGGDIVPDKQADAPVLQLQGRYRLRGFGTCSSDALTAAVGNIELNIGSDGAIGGLSNCNNFGGHWVLNRLEDEPGPLARFGVRTTRLYQTERACANADLNIEDTAFMRILSQAEKLIQMDATHILISRPGCETMTLARVP